MSNIVWFSFLSSRFWALSNARDDLNHNNQCSLKSMDRQQWRHEEVKPGGEYSQKLKTIWKNTFWRADDWNINVWLAEVNLFHFLCPIFHSNVLITLPHRLIRCKQQNTTIRGDGSHTSTDLTISFKLTPRSVFVYHYANCHNLKEIWSMSLTIVV